MTTVRNLHVRALSARARQGVLTAGNLHLLCWLGRSGSSWLKREGDGATPKGAWHLREAFIRPGMRAASGLKCRVLRRNRGWCDDPADRNYNRLVKLPYPGCHESLWRDDELYDVIVVLGYNDCPRRRGKGSAIFFHLAAPIGRPTQGCIAVSRKDMLKVLALCGPETRIKVW